MIGTPAPEALETSYDRLKAVTLRQSAHGRLPVTTMDAILRYASAVRRTVTQALKATRRLVAVHRVLRLDDAGEIIEKGGLDASLAHGVTIENALAPDKD